MIHIIKKTVILAIVLSTLALTSIAQPPPPDYGEEENQPAPIGSGIVILLALAGAYGVKKVYDATGSQIPKEPSA